METMRNEYNRFEPAIQRREMEIARRQKLSLTPEQEKKWHECCRENKWFTDLMIHYRQFVDSDISEKMQGSAEHWEIGLFTEWHKRLNPIFLRLPKRDYDNNILFVCDEKIMKKVFFSAFAWLPKSSFVDFKYLDLLSVQEIWYGRFKKNEYYDNDTDALYTFQNINHDVLCTYVSSDMAEVGKTPEILTTVILSRFENTGRRTKHQNTWIYFEGTIEELRNSKFSLWESFFKRNGAIIDLNPESKQNDSNEQADQDEYSLF